MGTIKFTPRYIQRVRDPLNNSEYRTERHISFVRLEDVPANLPLDPCPRSRGTRWDLYREIQNHLAEKDGTPGTFHLKNHGITVVAKGLRQVDDEDYEIDFASGHGIIDGKNTYQMILEAQRNPDIALPRNQHVKLEIVVGLADTWIAEVARGLNTSMQVQTQGLLALQPALRWIKQDLADQPYFSDIAWSETERGTYDIADILAVLNCFNIDFYPNQGTSHPVVAYADKGKLIQSFAQDYKDNKGKAYQRLRPILRDVLLLHDTISKQFAEIAEGRGPDDLVEKVQGQPFRFPFIQKTARQRLTRGGLLPILAAFRWLVEADPATGDVRWRNGFENVLSRWGAMAERFLKYTVDKHRELGRGVDAVGRSESHWASLHKEMALMDLMEQQAAPPPAPTPEPSSLAPAGQVDAVEER